MKKIIINILFILSTLLLLSIISVSAKDFPFKYEGRSYTRALPENYIIPQPLKISVKDDIAEFSIYSRGFKQGDVVYIELLTSVMNDISDVSILHKGKKLPFTIKDWGCRAFFVINPDLKISEDKIDFSYVYKGGVKTGFLNFTSKDGGFKVATAPLLFDGKFSDTKPLPPEILKLIEEAFKEKTAAFATIVPDYINSVMSHPRDMHYITSSFWSKRVYARYKIQNGKKIFLKPDEKIHRGVDFRGAAGSACFALLKGEVVFSMLTYYEGNMIILNHGNGVFSYYMHLNQSLVDKGEIVDAGKQIAEVGSTGRSTAAHLHVSLVINGVQADPLSMLSLPVRD